MKIGDLVRARYNTCLLGIIVKIKRKHYGFNEATFKEVEEYTILWNNGSTGYFDDRYLEPVKI